MVTSECQLGPTLIGYGRPSYRDKGTKTEEDRGNGRAPAEGQGDALGPARDCISSQLFRQCKRDQRVCGDDRNVLLAVSTLIGHRIRIDLTIDSRHPKLLAGLRVERAESTVRRCADEDQSSSGGGRTGAPAVASELFAFR